MGPLKGNQYFKHKVGAGGEESRPLWSSPGSARILFSGCAPKGNRMEIVLDVNETRQLMQYTWLSKNEKDYIVRSTRKL